LAKIWTPRGEEKIITSATPLADLGRALSISHDLCEVARTKTTSERRGEEEFGTWRIYKGFAVHHEGTRALKSNTFLFSDTYFSSLS
jgi:hypothetical protein